MNLATIELFHEQAEIIYRSIIAETRRSLPRSSVDIYYEESGKVKIIIRTEDIRALRASLNSYLRWINTLVEVLEVE